MVAISPIDNPTLTRSQFLHLANIPSSRLGYDRRYRRQDLNKHEDELKSAVGVLKWDRGDEIVEQSLQLDHEVKMGNGSDCHMVVSGPKVSDVHLVFYAVRTSSPLALVCMHDLSKSGYILNGERHHLQKRYKLGGQSFGTRVVILRDGDRVQIPHTAAVITYQHNWESYPLKPLLNETFNDYTLFREPFPQNYVDTNMWRIHNHPLGEGTFGVVNIATHRDLAVQVACKTIDSRMQVSIKWRERVKQEVGNMKNLDHPNVLRVFDQVKDRGYGLEPDRGAVAGQEWNWEGQEVWKAHMIFESAAGGDLFSYLEAYGSPRGLSEDEAKFLSWQLVKGIEHIHSNGVAHRDLKAENILLYTRTSFPRLLIGDFGSSTSLEAVTATVPDSSQQATREIPLEGTISYLPPERLKAVGRKVGTGGLGESLHGANRREAIGQRWFADEIQLDVWALGIVIYSLVAGRHPYQDDNDHLHDQEPLFLPSFPSVITPESSAAAALGSISGKRHHGEIEAEGVTTSQPHKVKRVGTTWEAFRNHNAYGTVGVKSTPQNREVERLTDAVIAFRNLNRNEWRPVDRWVELSGECQCLIASLLCYRAERRATVAQAKEHNWFQAQAKELEELYREIVVQGAR